LLDTDRTLRYAKITVNAEERRMSITLVVTLVLASSGVCGALTTLAYLRMPGRRLHRADQRRPIGPEHLRRVIVSAIFSPAVVFGFTHLCGGLLFSAEPVPVWRGALQAVGILALYDVLYYFLHRFLFHGAALRSVHAVHHRVRCPTTIDSLFLHPLEGFLGLGLLMLCTWIVGPVHVYAFGACFLVYSWVNLIVHAGVDLPVPYLGLVARKHAIHHSDMRSGNYASLSPLPDLLFGTAE
jgi:sterol desaturase/sphingolipid hydroxylase (fatty acid hydroxylase superfamily)